MIRQTFGAVEVGACRDRQLVELTIREGAKRAAGPASVTLSGMDEVEATLVAHAGRPAKLSKDQAAALKWARGMLA